jgi:hypothetical protein
MPPRKPATPGKPPAATFSDEVAEALGSASRPRPAADELADRESGSPGPIEHDADKP